MVGKMGWIDEVWWLDGMSTLCEGFYCFSMMIIFMCVCVCAQNLNWNDLLARRIKPPFVPTIVSLWFITVRELWPHPHPGSCETGPINFLSGWCKRRPESGCNFIKFNFCTSQMICWESCLQNKQLFYRLTKWLYSTVFLSASLYVSKRGAYWDRLCRDVVGRLSRTCTVAKRCIQGL